ncbi:MAG: hypothetical protein A2365_01380 [Candidatus Nealsonbacteria bacterium RIFOXYB1_FULL_40_15]|uniref:Probable peptidoglycan glycosyltransferase FtsW n=2 Tax=Candidatus Nealsoniibacteriota TaxID=1817911 RepID=A0A1G2ERG3_9BACT|nr:MAG: hypothetical protein A2365_01380 [Candidatus Nealsonbacteria bacterium RIFOXYB1_FULL_40_15]OGZ27868.1 MAG: hypothetical protein A2427_04110 [Candidatus Nealsonbacteria bacterium RIFOXYC1_FULL_40_7]OGZ28027.1 MAG: hypothetical protein A2562_01460 [Candidatus Nealsonbacteria bacterium RIFOXYD1_FULL_39_11]
MKFDYILALLASVLIIIGILILASVSGIASREAFGNTNHYLVHQLLWGILPGVLLAIFFFFIPLGFFKKWAWAAVLLNVIVMILVFIPGIGIIAGGAPRWLNLGFISVQPAEFFKLSFAIYIATWLSNPLRKGNVKYNLIPFLIIFGVVAFILGMQSDLSTLGVISFLGFAMYFSSDSPLWHTGAIAAIALASGALLIRISDYRTMRLKVLLGVIEDPMGLGYQIKQILIAIGSGGVIGLGLGMSAQKFGFVPQTMSDSIFAIYAEETGFLGCIFLIACFFLFLWRCFRIAKLSQDKFSRVFAVGIGSWIAIQAFINMGAMAGIIPLTGIPLPFISYGGSHIISEIAATGILLNISRKR